MTQIDIFNILLGLYLSFESEKVDSAKNMFTMKSVIKTVFVTIILIITLVILHLNR